MLATATSPVNGGRQPLRQDYAANLVAWYLLAVVRGLGTDAATAAWARAGLKVS